MLVYDLRLASVCSNEKNSTEYYTETWEVSALNLFQYLIYDKSLRHTLILPDPM